MHQYLIDKKPVNRRWLILLASTLVLIAALFYRYWLSPTIPAQYLTPLTVSTEDVALNIKGLGKIVPRTNLTLSAHEGGLLVELPIRSGQYVTKNQLLLSLTNPALEQELQKANYTLAEIKAQASTSTSESKVKLNQYHIELARAKTALKKQQLELSASKTLATQGVVSKIKFAQQQMAVEQMQLEVDSAKQMFNLYQQSHQEQLIAQDLRIQAGEEKLAYLKTRQALLKVFSPVDGIIKEVALSNGQQITQGQKLLELIEPSQLVANIQIPQYAIAKINQGMSATITTPNGSLAAEVEYVDAIIRAGSASVLLAIHNVPKWLKVDQSIEANIVLGTEPQLAITLPKNHDITEEFALYKINSSGSANYVNTELTLQNNKLLINGAIEANSKILLIPPQFHNHTAIEI